jgi:acetyl esterase/lipase
MALTMMVSKPAKSNHRGILCIVSGGWRSAYEGFPARMAKTRPLSARGYTLFFVVHSSVPRFTVADAVPDISRAVRFVRYHAKDYGIDPKRIGITGSSAGGHLSLMMATSPDQADNRDEDPVNRVSARVQAAAVLYPITDLLNFGGPGENVFKDKATLYRNHRSATFDFRQWSDLEQKYLPVTDSLQRLAMLKALSPIYEISADDPPTMIIHGDADQLVPLQQSLSFVGKLKAAGVPCELRIKKGADHGWDHEEIEYVLFADWFDRYLK